MDFEQRFELYGKHLYRFDAIFNGALSFVSADNFEIEFLDACRDATIIAQTIQDMTVVWQQSSQEEVLIRVPAFLDSVDATAMYALGVCGAKIVTLDPINTPNFLTLATQQEGEDSFTLVYSESMASESDIGLIHTIDYTVTFARYSGINPNDLHGSFLFEIMTPPPSMDSSSTISV